METESKKDYTLKFGTEDPRIEQADCRRLYIDIREHMISYGNIDFIRSDRYKIGNQRYWDRCKPYIDEFEKIATEHRKNNIEIDRTWFFVGYDDPKITRWRKKNGHLSLYERMS